jgi:ABC-type amino acid transport substrate-binding protein
VIEQLDAVESGRADVAIAAISITQAREERVDFSHRYFESGLGILTKSGSLSFADTLSAAFSLSLLRLFAFLLFSILIAGHIIWLIERKRNEAFPQSYLHGVWEGIWWAAVTVTTVGYGDKTPTGRPGRVFGILWMFAGLFIIANFTAGVTSQLTLQTLQGSINGPDDLPGKQIATVEGSTAAEWLAVQRIGHTAVETIEEAITLLDSEQVQAVVYDHPVLLYYTLQNENEDCIVPGGSFNQEDYGIALATGSPLREEINRALLTLFENGTYNRIYNKWYGIAAN